MSGPLTHNLVELRDISLTLGNKTILKNIHLTLSANSITTLIGPNGAGKSNLLKLIIGLQQPSSGKIIKAPGLRLGYLPQKIRLNTSMPLTVIDFLRLNSNGDQALLEDAIQQTQISSMLQRSLHVLSGGERQRVLLCRALLNAPHLLLLDEPAQGLDINNQAEFYQQLQKLKQHYQCSIFIVSHDLHLVMANTDEVICLNQHVCCSGHPQAVSQDAAFKALFTKTEQANLAFYTHHHDHKHPVIKQGQE